MKKALYYICGFLLLMITMPGCKKSKLHTHYLPNGTQTNFTVSLDSIGLVKESGANFDTVVHRLASQGYVFRRRVSEQILIITPTKKKIYTQSQIVMTVKSLVAANDSILETGGMVVYQDGVKLPYLVNDEIIVDFKTGINKQTQDTYFSQHQLSVVHQNAYRPQQYVVIPKATIFTDIFQTVRTISDTLLTKFVTPNFIVPVFPLSYRPNDPLFVKQWHILNSGAGGGTPDADSDADWAWDFTKGRSDITIAFIDVGFETAHPDLSPNWLINTQERDGTATVNDNESPNWQVDDVLGYNFKGCSSVTPCGSPILSVREHGTAVAGVAAAKGDNCMGGSGICPDCSILPIEIGTEAFAVAQCFYYAKERNAKIISCSFTYTASFPVVQQAIKDAYDAGIIIFVAAENDDVDHCQGPEADLTSLDEWVISVSRSSNLDQYDNSGYGNCIDVLAPSYYPANLGGLGTLGIVTTDLQGNLGYNTEMRDDCPVPVALESEDCPMPVQILDYTSCFQGTSSATPLVAGIAGLILSANPSITKDQLQHLLQDCTDRIDDARGHYSPKNGFSNYVPGGVSTHAYGRVNAYEAVKIAFTNVASGGRNGVDVFIRDNEMDWGNTEKPSNYGFEASRTFIGHWKSPDIKIDAPPLLPNAPSNNAEFEAFTDEKPTGLAGNKVYVRVRNRGFNKATTVNVKLYWVYGGLALPVLWSTFPQDTPSDPLWNFLGTIPIKDLKYSGSSVADKSADEAKIVEFNFIAPDPALNPVNHYCLLAMLDSPEDLLPAGINAIGNLDMVTPFYNNVTHRNIRINAPETETAQQILNVYNPLKKRAFTRIRLFNKSNIQVRVEGVLLDSIFTMDPGQKLLMRFNVDRASIRKPAEIEFRQEIWVDEKKKITGGFTFIYGKKE